VKHDDYKIPERDNEHNFGIDSPLTSRQVQAEVVERELNETSLDLGREFWRGVCSALSMDMSGLNGKNGN